MKLSELKALVYEFSGVVSTAQLKARYAEIRSLDMRRKASWEQALAIVKINSQEVHSQQNHSQQNHSQEDHSQQNHSQQNHSQEDHSQQNHSQQNHSQEFDQWLEHPPEEYQSLFKEIKFVSANYTNKLAETQQLSQEMMQLAKDLDELASSSQKEADRLKHQKQSVQQIVNADLN